MRISRKIGLATGAAALAAVSVAIPAQASSYEVHGNPTQARCYNSYAGFNACLYWGHSGNGGMWSTPVSVGSFGYYTCYGATGNPSNYEFWPGTGTGAGEPVWNNATALESWAPTTYVWYNSCFQGSDDWAPIGQAGPLVNTFNEDASIELITS